MAYHPQFLRLFLSLLSVAFVSANEGPQPGDYFDWKMDFPKWWSDLREQYSTKEIRKCAFLREIPDTNDHCASREKDLDHYYCIFGTEERPTWFCICTSSTDVGSDDFRFHCGPEMMTVKDFEHPSIDVADTNEQSAITKGDGAGKSNMASKTIVDAPAENDGVDEPTSAMSTEKEQVANGISARKGPQPGDIFDYRNFVFPQWWYDLRDQYGYREVRQCAYLHTIPDTNESCKAHVNEHDHYYCVFGTEEEPTWFCTCMELGVGEDAGFHFHCSNTGILTVEYIKEVSGETEDI